MGHGLDAPRPPAPAPGVTAEYGRYLGRACNFCHGDNLSGEGVEAPTTITTPNLTRGGRLGQWSEADFFNTMRTGVTPRGDKLNPEEMPWESIGRLTDDELKALWLYLTSVPPIVPEVAPK